jgi:hypothetical protein
VISNIAEGLKQIPLAQCKNYRYGPDRRQPVTRTSGIRAPVNGPLLTLVLDRSSHVSRNIAASIRARLKQHADTKKQDFNLTTTHHCGFSRDHFLVIRLLRHG